MGDSALIITDGGLGGLLALATAGAARSLPAAQGRPTHGVTTHGVTTAWIALPADRATEHAARTKSAQLAAQLHHISHCIRWEHQAPALQSATTHENWRAAAMAVTAMLMAAGQEALRLGLSRIIWPIHLGREDDQSRLLDSSVSAIAAITDRAAAAARLLTLDGGDAGLVIELPYIDFVDAQLADLAADLDLPLHACFLGPEGSAERARWETLLTAYGANPVTPRPAPHVLPRSAAATR